jgi:hypothetical protein
VECDIQTGLVVDDDEHDRFFIEHALQNTALPLIMKMADDLGANVDLITPVSPEQLRGTGCHQQQPASGERCPNHKQPYNSILASPRPTR